ncbi:MAG: T9SS type A sorting domain-containing protein [Bacteroidales bacterium]
MSVAGNALFVSDQNGMASYLDNGTTTIFGTTTYQEYLTSQRWHLVSPPVSGASIDVYYDIYLKEYNEPTDTWTYLVTPTTMPMNVGQGYAAWASDDYTGSTTVNYRGSLTNSNITLNSLDFTAGAAKEGFNLIGNPYPCALDFNSNWSLTNMSGWMVIYDNGIYRGISTDGTPYNGKTDGIIPPTQGFWVRALNASGSITIPASQRLHSNQVFYKEAKEFEFPIVRLETEVNGYNDETVVIFHPESTIGFDGYYDLSKFENVEEAPQLYTMTLGGNYAVNYYGSDYEDRIVPVGFKTLHDGLYILEASTISNFDSETGIYLEDLKTGTLTKLTDNPQYSFSYESGDDEHRFNLHFTKSSLSISSTQLYGMDIYAYQNTVYVKNPNLLDGYVVIYDVMGQAITKTQMNKEELIEIPVDRLGYYFVKVNSGERTLTEKVFLK